MDISTSETEKLRAAYCPPLDEPLFYAICSEYELPRDRDALSTVLDSLKASALEQADTEFDPSGTGGLSYVRDATETSQSSPEDSLSNGFTSITTGLSDLRWKDSEDLGHDLDGSTLDQKTAWLLNIFPDIPKRELASILESHGGALDTATDELLNLSFLNHGYDGEESAEHVPVLKSIDAFVEGVQEPRKGRKKKKTRTTESSRASSVSTPMNEREYIPSNVWSTMSKDVDFICSRTSLHPQTVRSTYHEHGARLASTIEALTAKEGTDYSRVQEVDPLVELQISEFQSQFQHVPKSQLYGVLILARKIPSAAYELLEAMTAPGAHESLGQMHAQYAPVDLKENTPFELPTRTSGTNVTAGPGRASAAVYRAAATHSFDQASSAYKKSRSDRLYGGVAAHYAEIGRERAMAAKELKAAEADTLVARQSSSNVLDLHGVSVQDAVRIANSQTQSWWHSLGDAKYASGGGGPARAGFRIVTGVGTHSKNHAPRIGPAVSKMLIREGWKIEIGHGELIVTGKSRR